MSRNKFKEKYLVKINRKGQGGFWVIGEIVEVFIDVRHRVKEKHYRKSCISVTQRHTEVEDITKKMYPSCEIVSVTYSQGQ